jgi:hypothetical protein
MELTTTQEATSWAATQEIPSILWNPKVHYSFPPFVLHACPSHAPSLDDFNYASRWAQATKFLVMSFLILHPCVAFSLFDRSILQKRLDTGENVMRPFNYALCQEDMGEWIHNSMFLDLGTRRDLSASRLGPFTPRVEVPLVDWRSGRHFHNCKFFRTVDTFRAGCAICRNPRAWQVL